MDLQISVFLLFILFTSGHSLICHSCQRGTCTQEKCSNGLTSCLSATYFGIGPYNMSVQKRCAPASDCASGFFDLGSVKVSAYYCNTDLCNARDAPDPPNVPNGKKCYYCKGHDCSNIMSCSGSEDRCITATSDLGALLLLGKGCASKPGCNAPEFLGFERVLYCSGNLCNSAKSVTQSFLFLCCSLLFFILLH